MRKITAKYFSNILLSRLYPKLKTRFSLSSKNPGFLANTFSTSQIINQVKKVKLPSHNGFSNSDRVAKKMDKVELISCPVEHKSIANKVKQSPNPCDCFIPLRYTRNDIS